MDTIIKYTANHGIIEIGAGNGQWAKAISTHHQHLSQPQSQSQSIPISPLKEFIVAYDDMSQLPLNAQIYHQYTQPARDYFYPNVQDRKGEDAVGMIKHRGRVLLLVYPPPGEMAMNVVKQYCKFDGNDVVIYVGEGIGGANADERFFNYFLNHEDKDQEKADGIKYKWCVLETIETDNLLGGGKGFEKVFVLKRVKVSN